MNTNATVFLIDDDTDDQDIFNIAVDRTEEDVKCVFANDGIQALEKINTEKDFLPDFIFIDMNMPGMNGRQILAEIKKIDRLKHIPVYMYSTSSDPGFAEENKKLGATDFIIKTPDINSLTAILKNILQRKFIAIMLFMFCMCAGFNSSAQIDTLPPVKELKKLSFEELMNIVVTSVSKSPEKLSEVASAIQVITNEDINRSTATRLPEALRLASNMQVAQSGSHDWGITARGFNGLPVTSSSLANKLLVMIDGRSIYTPLFGGVFWDVQNVMLKDLDRIEVISGPGGTLWGANAVNGIVNIITKSSKETQGLYASASSGSLLKNFGAVRYGSHVDSSLYFRVYGERYEYNSTNLLNGDDAMDGWNMAQGGFRMDYFPSEKNSFTLQGDLYSGEDDDTGSTLVNGQNIIWRWTHTISDKTSYAIQTYFDRTYRNISRQGFKDEINTVDLDLQFTTLLGTRNKIVWGLEYRVAQDKINSILDDFAPPKRTLELFSGFVQDQIAIVPEKLELTIGTKVLHNDYTDYEFHPCLRLAFTPVSTQTIWAAASRAVRTPTRYDADLIGSVLASYGKFKSEKVNAYELGYRFNPIDRVSISIATFYNQYFDVRSIDTNVTPPPLFYFANSTEAKTFGAEVSANFIATDWWRLRGGYSYLHEDFNYTSPYTYPKSRLFEAIDPQHQILIQSIIDIPHGFQFDADARFISELPAFLDGTKVPSYTSLNVRLGWIYKWLTVSVQAQNLLEENHIEFGTRKIPRRFMGKLSINLN